MAQFDELIGKTTGGYRIDQHLARGGMADVFVASDIELGRDVILKVLLPSYVENGDFVKRFRREARSMAKLQHPNIVQVYGTGVTSDGRPYIAMQYVRGGTLETRLRQLAADGQVMTTGYALAIARQMAAALQAAHEAGVVHRDLKPSNILLDEKGKPILTDLGIAYVAGDARLTRTDMFMGTPHYMSPEQARGNEPDARSDIYALGVVLFEMLAGQRPFDGESHYALIHQHASEPPPPLKKIRPGLDKSTYRVVDRTLEKDPARRYQTAAELVAALDIAMAVEGVALSMTPSGEWNWHANTGSFYAPRSGVVNTVSLTDLRRSPNRLPLLLAGLVVLALVIAGAAMLWPSSDVGSEEPTEVVAIAPTGIVTRIVTATPEPNLTPTSTLAAPVVVDIAEAGEEATEPPTMTNTASPVPTEPITTPETVATASVQRAEIRSNVWTRVGPGLTYPIAGTLEQGVLVTVRGRDRLRVWYLVQVANEEPAWVSAAFLDAPDGLLEGVAVATASIAQPTATVAQATEALTVTPTSSTSSGGGTNIPVPTRPAGGGATATPITVEPTDTPVEPTPTLFIPTPYPGP